MFGLVSGVIDLLFTLSSLEPHRCLTLVEDPKQTRPRAEWAGHSEHSAESVASRGLWNLLCEDLCFEFERVKYFLFSCGFAVLAFLWIGEHGVQYAISEIEENLVNPIYGFIRILLIVTL